MARDWSEDRELRTRAGGLEDDLARLDVQLVDAGLCLLGITAVEGSTYPTASGSVVYLALQSISGAETEGTAPATSSTGDHCWAICQGVIPPVGTPVLARSSGGYWII